MAPLEAAALVIVLILPFHWLVQRELASAANVDPRRCGIVILRDRALEARSPPVGEYQGHPIWGTVTFRGMIYRFDRIQQPRHRDALAAGELFLDPGLVYVLGIPA